MTRSDRLAEKIMSARTALKRMMYVYARKMAEFAESLTEEQQQQILGGFEWPEGIEGWVVCSQEIETMSKTFSFLCEASFDGCEYGWAYMGTPVKKSLTLKVPSEEMQQKFEKRCNKKHKHMPCAGKVTRVTSNYPEIFSGSLWKTISLAKLLNLT